MQQNNTETIDVRGLRYHINQWGNPNKTKLFCLHGWMDCGASYQFLAPYLSEHYHLIAPDWRGFGNSEHVNSSYWFADYFADLEVILRHYQADQPVNLIAHSMGGNVALSYAGIRPDRVAKVMSLEGLGLADTSSEQLQQRYAAWLDQVVNPVPTKNYQDWREFKQSIKAVNPSLDEQSIDILAQAWGKLSDEQQVIELRHDQKHRFVNPVRYNHQDVTALWRCVTAQVAIVLGLESEFYQRYQQSGRLQQAVDDLSVAPEHVFLIEQSQHMLHVEQPMLVADAIKQFIV